MLASHRHTNKRKKGALCPSKKHSTGLCDEEEEEEGQGRLFSITPQLSPPLPLASQVFNLNFNYGLIGNRIESCKCRLRRFARSAVFASLFFHSTKDEHDHVYLFYLFTTENKKAPNFACPHTPHKKKSKSRLPPLDLADDAFSSLSLRSFDFFPFFLFFPPPPFLSRLLSLSSSSLCPVSRASLSLTRKTSHRRRHP